MTEDAIQIPLTKGQVAIIDKCDLELVCRFRWFASLSRSKNGKYRAGASIGKNAKMYMHHLIAGFHKGMEIDHINGNSLDNRRCNLRICTRAQNSRNRGYEKRIMPSKYKGVTFDRINRNWCSRIVFNYKSIWIGRFETEEWAAKAYDWKAKELYGEFACLNFPEAGVSLCSRLA